MLHRNPGINEQVKTATKSWKACDETNLADSRSQLSSRDPNPVSVKPTQPGAEHRRRELRRKKSEDESQGSEHANRLARKLSGRMLNNGNMEQDDDIQSVREKDLILKDHEIGNFLKLRICIFNVRNMSKSSLESSNSTISSLNYYF